MGTTQTDNANNPPDGWEMHRLIALTLATIIAALLTYPISKYLIHLSADNVGRVAHVGGVAGLLLLDTRFSGLSRELHSFRFLVFIAGYVAFLFQDVGHSENLEHVLFLIVFGTLFLLFERCVDKSVTYFNDDIFTSVRHRGTFADRKVASVVLTPTDITEYLLRAYTVGTAFELARIAIYFSLLLFWPIQASRAGQSFILPLIISAPIAEVGTVFFNLLVGPLITADSRRMKNNLSMAGPLVNYIVSLIEGKKGR